MTRSTATINTNYHSSSAEKPIPKVSPKRLYERVTHMTISDERIKNLTKHLKKILQHNYTKCIEGQNLSEKDYLSSFYEEIIIRSLGSKFPTIDVDSVDMILAACKHDDSFQHPRPRQSRKKTLPIKINSENDPACDLKEEKVYQVLQPENSGNPVCSIPIVPSLAALEHLPVCKPVYQYSCFPMTNV